MSGKVRSHSSRDVHGAKIMNKFGKVIGISESKILNKISNNSRITHSKIGNLGFTLVEMMMVLVVLGLVSGVAIISVLGYHARARDTVRVTDLNTINKALEGYYSLNDAYPPTECGTTGYDCTNIDASAFITSAQSKWSPKVIA